jgi:type IV secretion system protein VirB6
MYIDKKLLYLILVLLGLIIPSKQAVSGLFDHCVMSYDFGGTMKSQMLTLSPIDRSCSSMCQNQCKAFSFKNSAGSELNDDIIYDCLTECQSGRTFSSYYRQEVSAATTADPTATKISASQYISINTNCFYNSRSTSPAGSSIPATYALNSNVSVSAGDKINFILLTISGLVNKVYMCGKRNVVLDPIINSIDSGDWSNDSGLTLYTTQDQHICLQPRFINKLQSDGSYSLEQHSAFNWFRLTNYKLWNPTVTSDITINDKCYWNARNSNFTSTGIYVKDGDELTINYQGEYPWYQSPANTGRKDLYTGATNPRTSSNAVGSLVNAWTLDGYIQLLESGNTDLSLNNEGLNTYLSGEDARKVAIGNNVITQVGKSVPSDQTDPAKTPIQFGLTGFVIDQNMKGTRITSSTCPASSQTELDSGCYSITDPGQSSYTFSGNLSGFPERGLLAFRHYDYQTGYFDNWGGYKVSVNWGGCPLTNGKNIQFAVHDPSKGSAIVESSWQDITDAILNQTDTINPTKSGYLYFRIKPFPSPATGIDYIDQLYTNQGNRFGQYYFILSKLSTTNINSGGTGMFRDIVSYVVLTLFGTQPNTSTINIRVGNNNGKVGVVQLLYAAIISQPIFIRSIQALLTLYVAITGIGFLIGTIQSSQQELITRLMKFAVVAALIDPNSWAFFANNFYGLFISGGMELIAMIVTGSLLSIPIQDVLSNPIQVFSLFDLVVAQFFTPEIWKKIYALFFINNVGFLLIFIICSSSIVYFIAVTKGVVIFLMSMISTSVLILVGPIFMCFMLFKTTREFFDSWWKYLLSFTLQPVAVFTSIMIFNTLIMIAIKSMLGFTACETCLFGINLPGIFTQCIIPIYEPMVSTFYPGNLPTFTVPVKTFTSSIIFAMLCLGMFEFVEFVSKVTNIVVIGGQQNVTDLSGYSAKALGAVKDAVVGKPMAVVNYTKNFVQDLKKR